MGGREPQIDCTSYRGSYFIEVTPEPNYADVYSLSVGDSLQVQGTVRRVDEAIAVWSLYEGWSCSFSASTSVVATVTYSATDTTLIRVKPNGWIRGLRDGMTDLRVSSATPAATTEVAVWITR